MAELSDKHLLEQLRFRPKWWWDPIPDWFIDHLDVDVRRDFLRVQMEKQVRVLEVEMDSIKQSMKLLGRG